MELVTNQGTQLSDAVQLMLGQLLHDVDSSKTLHKMGLDTKLSKFISSVIEDPIKAQVQSHENTFSAISGTVDIFMKLFLKKKSENIAKVFKETNGGSIIYYILFNEDTEAARNEVFEWLNVFDDLGFDDKVKVLVRFIPADFKGSYSFKEELVLI